MIQGDLYCKNCFVRMFKLKGSYGVFGNKALPASEKSSATTPMTPPREPRSAEAETPSTPATPPPAAHETISHARAVFETPQAASAPVAVSSAIVTRGTTREKARAVFETPQAASTAPKDSTPSRLRIAGGGLKLETPKCSVCQKAAYPQESQTYDQKVFHKSCFKCLNCKSSVTITGVAMFQGDLYCKVCFVRMFKTKGSYGVFAHGSGEGAADASPAFEKPKAVPKIVMNVATAPKCPVCSTAAYPQESQTYEQVLYHKACFRCFTCKASLSLSSIEKNDGKLYCTTCAGKVPKSAPKVAGHSEEKHEAPAAATGSASSPDKAAKIAALLHGVDAALYAAGQAKKNGEMHESGGDSQMTQDKSAKIAALLHGVDAALLVAGQAKKRGDFQEGDNSSEYSGPGSEADKTAKIAALLAAADAAVHVAGAASLNGEFQTGEADGTYEQQAPKDEFQESVDYDPSQ